MQPLTCPTCGHEVDTPGAQHCTNCGARLFDGTASGAEPPGAGEPGAPAAPGGQGSAGEPPPATPPPGNSVPFEDTSQPFFKRFIATIGMAFSNPMQLFSNMSSGDLGMPLLYGVIVITVVVIFSILWNMLFSGLALLGGGIPAEELAVSTGVYVLFMFLSPLLGLIGLFVWTAIFHVCLLILGDGERGFAMTFRAIAYGYTPNLLAVVPICGGFIGGIWGLVLTILAAKMGHGTDTWRAIVAYFLPTIVCCCLAIWLLSAFGVFGILSQQ